MKHFAGTDEATQRASPHPVILFDGVCNLCSGVVNFLIDRDQSARFRFASIQSEVGAGLLRQTGLSEQGPDTVVLIDRGRVYVRSDAALAIAGGLNGPWRLLSALRVIPRPVRDLVYRVIARYRYRIFGRKSECMIPTPERRARFLTDG